MQVDAAYWAVFVVALHDDHFLVDHFEARRILITVDNVHRRVVIYLQKPRLHLLIDKDVEAEYLIDTRLVIGLLLGVGVLRVKLHL